jgi:hypothetical protein
VWRRCVAASPGAFGLCLSTVCCSLIPLSCRHSFTIPTNLDLSEVCTVHTPDEPPDCVLCLCIPLSCKCSHSLTILTNLELSGVAPLLCAGITTFSPYKDHGLDKAGLKIGVVSTWCCRRQVSHL